MSASKWGEGKKGNGMGGGGDGRSVGRSAITLKLLATVKQSN